MIEYVIAQNPDNRILEKASQHLAKGNLVCFPTDTNWIVTCDPENKNAVEKLYQLKGESLQKHFSLLCDSISTASELAMIDDSAFRIIKKLIPGHYTFIFNATKKMAKTLKASKVDKEVGIRFSPNILTNKIISTYGKALLSTNLTETQMKQDPPYYSFMIEEELKGRISLIIDPGELEFAGPSTIISFVNEVPELIRQGQGPWPF